MERAEASQIAHATVAILEQGFYVSPTGNTIVIADDTARAVANTVSYPPGSELPTPKARYPATTFDVVNQTTLAAARQLAEQLTAQGEVPAALNFASAKRPGGGFLNGALAQEESLARASALYACLLGNPMYTYHRQLRDSLYSDYAIYSPAVPVFREDDGTLLETPYPCAFITSPAVNAGAHANRSRGRRRRIPDIMQGRVELVLKVAAAHGHSALVLGAWGCGVFGNDPALIARLFGAALKETYRGVFAQVIFAVLDHSEDERFIGPFRDEFAAR